MTYRNSILSAMVAVWVWAASEQGQLLPSCGGYQVGGHSAFSPSPASDDHSVLFQPPPCVP